MHTKFQPDRFNLNLTTTTTFDKHQANQTNSNKFDGTLQSSIPDKLQQRYQIDAKIYEDMQLKEYLAFDNQINKRVIMKRYYDIGSEGIPQEAIRQMITLQNISKTKGIQHIIDIYQREKELIIVYEQLDITLEKIFSSEPYYKISENMAKVYIFQILQIVSNLHVNGVIHNNICMKSIFIDSFGTLVLGKFEKSLLLFMNLFQNDDHDQLSSLSLQDKFQTLDQNYLAPELLLGQNQSTFQTDMWAIGCLLFNFVSGFSPFKEPQLISILFRIFKTLGTPTMNLLEFPSLTQIPYFSDNFEKFPLWSGMNFSELIPHVSQECRDLIMNLLQIEPSRRISAKNALNHAFFYELNKSVMQLSINN